MGLKHKLLKIRLKVAKRNLESLKGIRIDIESIRGYEVSSMIKLGLAVRASTILISAMLTLYLNSFFLNANETNTQSDPKGFLLDLALPPDIAEERFACLFQRYKSVWQKKYSPATARALYNMQVIIAISGYYKAELFTIATAFFVRGK
jgi:hypothetical protein